MKSSKRRNSKHNKRTMKISTPRVLNKKTSVLSYSLFDEMETPTPILASALSWDMLCNTSKKRKRITSNEDTNERRRSKRVKIIETNICDYCGNICDENERCNGVLFRKQMVNKLNIVKTIDDKCIIVEIQWDQIQKRMNLRNRVNQFLQYTALGESSYLNSNSKIFLYLQAKPSLSDPSSCSGYYAIGCVIAHQIRYAYRVVVNGKSNTNLLLQYDTAKKEKAILSIDKLWVHSDHRRNGIATTLCDAAREHTIYGINVPIRKCAISEPTEDGASFFMKYCSSSHILVVKHNS
jgi:ribosomal protein S18 acetylase RimI-like enzyme/ribosomal protein L32